MKIKLQTKIIGIIIALNSVIACSPHKDSSTSVQSSNLDVSHIDLSSRVVSTGSIMNSSDGDLYCTLFKSNDPKATPLKEGFLKVDKDATLQLLVGQKIYDISHSQPETQKRGDMDIEIRLSEKISTSTVPQFKVSVQNNSTGKFLIYGADVVGCSKDNTRVACSGPNKNGVEVAIATDISPYTNVGYNSKSYYTAENIQTDSNDDLKIRNWKYPTTGNYMTNLQVTAVFTPKLTGISQSDLTLYCINPLAK